MFKYKLLFFIYIFSNLAFCNINICKKNSFLLYEEDKIPFELIKGYIVIKVRIGNELFNFLLDTGAPTVVDVKKNELYKDEKNQIKVYDSNQIEKKLQKIKMSNMKIGKISLKNINAIASNLDEIKKILCVDIVGILGADVMSNYYLKIDYIQKYIILTNKIKNIQIDAECKPINFTTNTNKTPLISLFQNNIKIDDFILDTGSNNSIVVSIPSLIDTNKSTNKQVMLGVSFGAFGYIIDTTYTYKIDNLLCVNNVKIDSVIIHQRTKKTNSRIGYEFLKNYSIVIDWKKKKLYLNRSKIAHTDEKNSFGLKIIYYNDKFIITKINEEGIAFNKGLMLFDEIVKINDVYCDFLFANNYCLNDYSVFLTSDVVKLVIKRNDNLFELILKN
jgi:hypothetical protein